MEEQLTPAQQYQRAEKNRLELEGYCNKIRQGLEGLGPKSIERAIWELVQNARDVSSNAQMRIELFCDKIVFSHHGEPFYYTSLRALVKQDSSKDRTGADVVGQYGTGFMTTHKFNTQVYVSAPYCVKSGKDNIDGYFLLNDLLLDRSKVDTPEGITEMGNELNFVEEICNKTLLREKPDAWTRFCYYLNSSQVAEISDHLNRVIRFLPFVLTINERIESIVVDDYYSDTHRQVTRHSISEPKAVSDGWSEIVHYISIGGDNEILSCKTLQSKEKDVIILPPFHEFCGNVKDIPSLFLWFPLLGTEQFGVNFIFHSPRFYPVEKRNNILLPEDSESTRDKAGKNETVLHEMIKALLDYYTHEDNMIDLSLPMCEVNFVHEIEDEKTLAFYKKLQETFNVAVPNWKVIPTEEGRLCVNDSRLRLLHPDFYQNLSEEKRKEYEPILARFASLAQDNAGNSFLFPTENLIEWSEIVYKWDCERDAEFFVTLEQVCDAIKDKSHDLHKFLEFLRDSDKLKLLDEHALLPNKKGELCKRADLQYDKSIDDSYSLLEIVMGDDARKMFDPSYLDICSVGTYSASALHGAITRTMGQWRNSSITANEKKDLSDERLTALMRFCSATSQPEFTNYRGNLMRLIPAFFKKTFEQIYQPKLEEKEDDFYSAAFNMLIDYTLLKVSQSDTEYVKDHEDWIVEFLKVYSKTTDKDLLSKLNNYGVLPNQLHQLKVLDELVRNVDIPSDLNQVYVSVFGNDLRSHWALERVKDLFDFGAEKAQSVGEAIEKELEADIKTDDPTKRRFDSVLRLVILKINESSNWRSWFTHINDNKPSYTFKMQSGPAQKSLFSLMDMSDGDLERLAKLNESGQLSGLIDKMEHIKELEDEKQSHFYFCLRIGKFIENEIRNALKDSVFEVITRKHIDEDLTVNDIQNGQDIIIRNSDGENVYYVEVKAKWNFEVDTYAHMSLNQLRMAALHPDCYSLCCVDLTDKTKIDIPADSTKEFIEEHSAEIIANTHVHLSIGEEINDIMMPILAADADTTGTMMRIGDYRGNMTKKSFQSGASFKELVDRIISKL